MKNNVLYNIIVILNSNKFYGLSQDIENIKGKNKIKYTFKEKIEQFKRSFLFFIKNKI